MDGSSSWGACVTGMSLFAQVPAADARPRRELSDACKFSLRTGGGVSRRDGRYIRGPQLFDYVPRTTRGERIGQRTSGGRAACVARARRAGGQAPARRAAAVRLRPRRRAHSHARGARPRRPLPRDLHRADREDGPAPSGPDRADVGPGARLPAARRPRDAAAVRPLRALPRAGAAPRAPARDRVALPDHRRRADLRAARGRELPVVLHLLRLAAVRADLRVGVPLGVRAGDRSDPARRRLPPPRGARGLRHEHPGGLARAARQPRDRAVRLRGAHAGGAGGRPARLPLARAARAPLRHDRRGPDRRRRLPRRRRPSSWWTAATSRACACAWRRPRWRS